MFWLMLLCLAGSVVLTLMTLENRRNKGVWIGNHTLEKLWFATLIIGTLAFYLLLIGTIYGLVVYE